jgi:hypothetical protein
MHKLQTTRTNKCNSQHVVMCCHRAEGTKMEQGPRSVERNRRVARDYYWVPEQKGLNCWADQHFFIPSAYLAEEKMYWAANQQIYTRTYTSSITREAHFLLFLAFDCCCSVSPRNKAASARLQQWQQASAQFAVDGAPLGDVMSRQAIFNANSRTKIRSWSYGLGGKSSARVHAQGQNDRDSSSASASPPQLAPCRLPSRGAPHLEPSSRWSAMYDAVLSTKNVRNVSTSMHRHVPGALSRRCMDRQAGHCTCSPRSTQVGKAVCRRVRPVLYTWKDDSAHGSHGDGGE